VLAVAEDEHELIHAHPLLELLGHGIATSASRDMAAGLFLHVEQLRAPVVAVLSRDITVSTLGHCIKCTSNEIDHLNICNSILFQANWENYTVQNPWQPDFLKRFNMLYRTITSKVSME